MENSGTTRLKVDIDIWLPQHDTSLLRIILEWKKFELEISEDCSADYVMIIEENQDENMNKTNLEDNKQTERLCGYFGENVTL